MGLEIIKQQEQYNWGEYFLEKFAIDLKKEFPNMKGFSLRNIKYVRQFARKFGGLTFGQQVAAQMIIPWGHHLVLLDKNLETDVYLWYAQQTLENGWSRNILSHQIGSGLYERQVKTINTTNFKNTLPKLQSDLAHEILKDPYILDFVDKDGDERDLEKSLIKHIQKFLLELGRGFAFIGTQYHLEVGGDDFYIDMLMYNYKLHAFVALELKMTKFKPEYAGQMNFYLTALDKEIKHQNDNPSIGIILCREKNKIVAEYALNRMTSPMGITDYKLPKDLQNTLPTEEELNAELQKMDIDKEG